MRRLLVLSAIASLIIAMAACGEDFKDCYAGDLIACTCNGGATGYATCGASGDYKSSACVCDGTTPGIDAGPSLDAANDADAAGRPCTTDADCPNGCSMRGVCRNPQ